MPSSTILGSTMMSFTSSGPDLYKRLMIMEFMHTDLPEPVVPAISIWGIFASVRLNKLTNCADDIALSLGASGVRIAAVPGKISIVGIEVPNRAVTTVSLREVIDSPEFGKSKSKSSFAVGKDIGGSCVVGNIAKLPHVLIAGTTGSGKSVCTNSLIVSLLYKSSPEDVRFIMVDPKMVELAPYNGIPHLLIPVGTDPKKAAGDWGAGWQ